MRILLVAIIILIQFTQTAIAQSRNSPLWYCFDGSRSARSKNDYTRFYAAVSAGVSGFGTTWIGKAEGYSFVLDAEAAYFFIKNFGMGLKFNSSMSKLNIKP